MVIVTWLKEGMRRLSLPMFWGGKREWKLLYTSGRQAQMVIGMLYLKHSSWCADSWWMSAEKRKGSWIWNYPSFSCVGLWWGYGLKQLWPPRVCSGGTSEALRLPEWEQHRRPKSLRGECVSDAPGRGSGGQKIQSGEPGCFSESLGILPLPARDLWTRFHQLPSENKPGTVRSACLSARRWNMASLHQQVAYFSTLEFILRGRPPSTYQRQGTGRV